MNGLSLLMLLCCVGVCSATTEYIGDRESETFAPAVHLIDLYDEDGAKIDITEARPIPFSLRQTCGQCHDVARISGGHHFNFNRAGAEAGRGGQPWVFIDAATGTQIPLSYRDWPGVYHPDQMGVTPWRFLKRFGRQVPGNVTEADEGDEPDYDARWMVSGELEINCLACHDGHAAYDGAEYAEQVRRENLRWAAAGASHLAEVRGNASQMDEMYDYLIDDVPDDPKLIPPSMTYHAPLFHDDGKVFMDVGREIENERCYFCHARRDTGGDEASWRLEEDVHVAAGMRCVDCHHNELDHQIVRGYEGEVNPQADAEQFTCEGCHLGGDDDGRPTAGRFAAPRPEHRGIPPIHMDKLTCTACHSGPWPDGATVRVQTARAHGLGTHGVEKTGGMLPHVYGGLFVRDGNGKIAAHEGISPAFWAVETGDGIRPIALDVVREYFGGRRNDRDGFVQFEAEDVTDTLKRLQGANLAGEPVLVAGGQLHRLNAAGALASEAHPAAELFTWPIAHRVRPAAQSLGVRSCEDCHASTAGFFFAEVPVDGPFVGDAEVRVMADLQQLDANYMEFFGMSFLFRPMLKTVVLVVVALAAVVLLAFLLRGLQHLLPWLAQVGGVLRWCGGLCWLGAVVSFVVLAVTGLVPWLLGDVLTGYSLSIHVTMAGVFSVCLLLGALFRAERQVLRGERTLMIGKVCFWLTLVALLPLILSIAMSMVPVLGPDGQRWMLLVHQVSAVVISITFIGYLLLPKEKR